MREWDQELLEDVVEKAMCLSYRLPHSKITTHLKNIPRLRKPGYAQLVIRLNTFTD